MISSNTNGVHIRMFDTHILCGKVFFYRFDWPINRHLERKRSNIHQKRREEIAFFLYLHKYSCILQKLENALRKEEIMTTEFGKALRKIRIEKDENMAAMAKKMEISLSYLSAIETGTRAVPDGFVEKLSHK